MTLQTDILTGGQTDGQELSQYARFLYEKHGVNNDEHCRSRLVGFLREPSDLHLHCLQRQDIIGFNRARINVGCLAYFSAFDMQTGYFK